MKKMTIVLDDETLYTAIKAEAARLKRPLKEVVTQVLREWREAREDEECVPELEVARAEWHAQGGIEARELFRQLEADERAGSV